MEMERVVVTGVGVASCVGVGREAFWDALIHGRSGIDQISSYDHSAYPIHIAGEVGEIPLAPQDAKRAKRMARFAQMAFASAQEAMAQAGLSTGEGVYAGDPARAGVCVGTGIGGEPFLEAEFAKFMERGAGRFHPLTVPIVITNMAAGNIAMYFGLQGPNLCISTACATGNHNIGNAVDQIRLGRADVMVAGGAESTITPFAIDGYHQLGALSTRNGDPARASRPFSRERDGFVLAEGAGILVLESLTHARGRGAEILAEVKGHGTSADAYHLTAPHPESRGAIQALRAALADSRTNPEEVSYINAHGTSTPLNDALETQAIKAVFGPHAPQVPISSIKSMVGHSLGAAAGLEAVACVLAISRGVIPPTINLDDPDPELDLDYVPLEARQARLDVVLSNAFAFGGQNAVVVFSRL